MSDTTDNIGKRREELQKELDELQRKERDAFERRKKAFKRDWQFTLTPDTSAGRHKLRDPAMKWYVLEGKVLNAEEAHAAGYSREELGGSMSYLFNSATGLFSGEYGGGRIFIVDGYWASGREKPKEAEEDAERVWKALEALLAVRPEGGDVTDIIRSQRHLIL